MQLLVRLVSHHRGREVVKAEHVSDVACNGVLHGMTHSTCDVILMQWSHDCHVMVVWSSSVTITNTHTSTTKESITPGRGMNQ